MNTSIGDSRVGVGVVVAFGKTQVLGLGLGKREALLDVELGLAAFVGDSGAEFEDNAIASSIGGCECSDDSIELTSSLHSSWPFDKLDLRSCGGGAAGGIFVSDLSREGDLVGGDETEIRRWSWGSERAAATGGAMGEVM